MKKYKLAIDATYNPSGGTKTQIINMLKYFSKIKELNILLYCSEENKKILMSFKQENLEIKIVKFIHISRIIRLLWQQLILPISLIFKNIDVIFCPGNITPIFTNVKNVQWIGTIGPFYPEFYREFSILTKISLYLNKLIMISSAYMSSAVIFESEFTKNLFVKKYKINNKRAHVINIGNDSFYRRIHKNLKKFEKFKDYNYYALCVSHLYPYKNILNMLSAFKIAINKTDLKLKLLIAGSRDYKYYDIKILNKIDELKLNNNVILLGNVEKNELRYLYSNCELMIFPSPFENFAYTLVEAMGCGAPIVCSNTTAMPETCNDAALYFDPYDINDMAEKISKVIFDDSLKESMIKKSLDRANQIPDYNEVTIRTLKIIEAQI